MNEYITHTIATQRMDETARNTRYAYQIPRSDRRRTFPRFTWSFVQHTAAAPA